MPVLIAREASATDVGDICVAVHRTSGHVGMIYRDDAGVHHLLHLCWHHVLRRQPPDTAEYPIWVSPQLPPGRGMMVAEFCNLVFERDAEQEIPYAFGQPDDVFDESGWLKLGPGKRGLTCATFILAVFHAASYPLVNYSQWPQREGDREWCEQVIQGLRNSRPPAEPEHVAALEADGYSVRYKPLEVAGSADCDPLPASFVNACLRALCIDDLIRHDVPPAE